MEKDKAIQRYIESQQSLKTVLASIPEDQKPAALVEGTWTVKELLCHFIGWDQSLILPLIDFIKNGDFSVNMIHDHDAYNAIQTSSRKDWSLEKITEEANQTSQRLLELVDSLDPNQCQVKFPAPWGGEGTIPIMLAGLAWHMDEHLKDVEASLRKHGMK